MKQLNSHPICRVMLCTHTKHTIVSLTLHSVVQPMLVTNLTLRLLKPLQGLDNLAATT